MIAPAIMYGFRILFKDIPPAKKEINSLRDANLLVKYIVEIKIKIGLNVFIIVGIKLA